MHNLFGTDGIRGRMGTGIFIPEKLIQLGRACAQWAQQKYGTPARILLVHDTRISASFVKAALKTGLLQASVQLEDAGVLPTPACAHLMKRHATFDCSIVISASHNPYDDNGIKLMDSVQGKLTTEDEEHISQLFFAEQTPSAQYGTESYAHTAAAEYQEAIMSLFPPHFLAGIRVVLDTAHGATYAVAPAIFRALGAEVIMLNDAPTGYNINEHCGALHPEQLARTVLAEHAHLGFAFDGDGDRVIAVNRLGVIKDGDDLLALLLQHPTYRHSDTIVGTSMTNEGFAHYLQQQHKQLVRTAVGDKYVVEQLTQQGWLLGGEPSGHIILHDLINTGDGILAALRVLEVVQQTQNWDLHTFEHYPQVMINMPVSSKKDLTSSPFAAFIAQAQHDLQTGRVLVRYSGTENVLRVMVEGATAQQAQAVCAQLAQKISSAFS